MGKTLDMIKSSVRIACTLAFLATPLITNEIVHRITKNPYNMKVMPRVQPWVFLYDKNNDREADSVMELMRGGEMGGVVGGQYREPTEKEKEWYRNN